MQQDTRNAVEVLMDAKGHNRNTVIFEKGKGLQPYDMWTKKLNLFLRKQ